MADVDPRALVVLVLGGRAVLLGTDDPARHRDLGLVDRLLRIRLGARRLGWTVALAQVDADLEALIELVGVAECLGLRPAS